MNTQFEKLPLKQELLKNLAELKFELMTPIQEKALPVVISGKDIIAQAKTGSGKTAVFGLGILNGLEIPSRKIQSLILCPTRELAEQVAKEIRTLARLLKNIKVLTICGGTSEFFQERSLFHGANIIVGTPGRVLRLLKKEMLDFRYIRSFVLDEADRMLDMGFHADIMEVVSNLPDERQTMLFSATFPERIKELSLDIQEGAESIIVDTEHSVNIIDQKFYSLDSHKEKNEALLKVLVKYNPDNVIVFCKTKQFTSNVAKYLNKHGVSADAIHGDLQQCDRTAILTKFSNRSLSVLVATDVAARGLDIEDLAAVVNYDLPTDPKVYIHRIGRTGRAGRNGMAFSFYLSSDYSGVNAISDLINTPCDVEDLDELSIDESFTLTPPMKTMYIGGGKKSKLRPGDIVGAITGDVGLNADDIGDISILTIISYVAIRKEKISLVIKKLNSGKIKNRKFKVGLA